MHTHDACTLLAAPLALALLASPVLGEDVEAPRLTDTGVLVRGLPPGAVPPLRLHFVLANALNGGDGPTAIEAARQLASLATDQAGQDTVWTQPIQAAPHVAHARFSTLATVLALPPQTTPFVAGHWHYARGIAFARVGRASDARDEATRIRIIAESEEIAALSAAGLPAAETLAIAAELVEARADAAAGDHSGAARRFHAAAGMQEALPDMEPPFWFDPIRPSEGAALLAAGRIAEAIGVFQAAIAKRPDDGWSAAGLLAAAQRIENAPLEEEMRALLARSWFGTALPPLDRL